MLEDGSRDAEERGGVVRRAAVERGVPGEGALLGGVALHPRVRADLAEGDAARRLHGEHAGDEVAELRGDSGRLVVPLDDVEGDLDGVPGGEREQGGDHGVEDDAQGPDVDLRAEVGDLLEDLGGGVVGAAAVLGEAGVGGPDGAHAPVDDDRADAVLDHDVLGLEVAVDDLAALVGVEHGADELAEEEAGGGLREGLDGDEVEEGGAGDVAHLEDVQVLGAPGVVEGDDVGVRAEELHDLLLVLGDLRGLAQLEREGVRVALAQHDDPILPRTELPKEFGAPKVVAAVSEDGSFHLLENNNNNNNNII